MSLYLCHHKNKISSNNEFTNLLNKLNNFITPYTINYYVERGRPITQLGIEDIKECVLAESIQIEHVHEVGFPNYGMKW